MYVIILGTDLWGPKGIRVFGPVIEKLRAKRNDLNRKKDAGVTHK